MLHELQIPILYATGAGWHWSFSSRKALGNLIVEDDRLGQAEDDTYGNEKYILPNFDDDGEKLKRQGATLPTCSSSYLWILKISSRQALFQPPRGK